MEAGRSIYVFDTSALVKRYYPEEPGHDAVKALIVEARHENLVLTVVLAETLYVLHRLHYRDHRISGSELSEYLAALDNDIEAGAFDTLDVTHEVALAPSQPRNYHESVFQLVWETPPHDGRPDAVDCVIAAVAAQLAADNEVRVVVQDQGLRTLLNNLGLGPNLEVPDPQH